MGRLAGVDIRDWMHATYRFPSLDTGTVLMEIKWEPPKSTYVAFLIFAVLVGSVRAGPLLQIVVAKM